MTWPDLDIGISYRNEGLRVVNLERADEITMRHVRYATGWATTVLIRHRHDCYENSVVLLYPCRIRASLDWSSKCRSNT